jgi:hypothetical protein
MANSVIETPVVLELMAAILGLYMLFHSPFQQGEPFAFQASSL